MVKIKTTRKRLPWFLHDIGPDIYRRHNYVVVDIETTNKGVHPLYRNDFLFGYALHSTGKLEYVSDISQYLDLAQWCVDNEVFIVAHNAKFELQFLAKEGFPIEQLLVYDTMVAEKKILSNRYGRLDLDSVASRYGGQGKGKYIDLLMKNGVCPSEMPTRLIQDRCRVDVLDTENIFKKQLTILEENGIMGVTVTGNLLVPVLADIEINGMYLDKELVIELYREGNQEYNNIVDALNEIAPINYSSPQQVAKLLYKDLKFDIPKKYGKSIVGAPNDEFPDGVPKTDADTVATLKPRTKKQKRFIELKKQESKLRTKLNRYFALYMEALEKEDGYVYGNINQTIADTQRLSSSKPNLQNQDRSLKKVFTARKPGWKIRQDDYSQLEYRVAGFMGQCPVALEDIKNNVDVHGLSTGVIFEKEVEDLHPDSPEYKKFRTLAKSHTFKPLYGGLSGTEKEQEYYRKFMEKHTGIQKWHDKLIAEANYSKKIVTPTGLTFYFPDAGYTNSGYFRNQTNIKNYPVQYLATGEIAIIGTIFMWHRMKQEEVESFIINEVHDAIISEQHPDEVGIMDDIAYKAMVVDVKEYLKQMYDIDFNYPLEIETEVNQNWGFDKS